MPKIAIVNLANSSKSLNFDNIIKTINDPDFAFINYSGDEKTYIEQFHKALRDSSVDVVWFLCGGTNCIRAINLIDWELVSKSKALFLGSSDITHFFQLAPKTLSQRFYYFPNFLDFSDKLNGFSLSQLLVSMREQTIKLGFKNQTVSLSLNEVNIIGGHSIISSIFKDRLHLSTAKENYYFWEHHGNFESIEMYKYWLQVLSLGCKELGINNVILGNSLIYENGKPIDMENQYKIASQILSKYRIFTIDQTINPVPIYNLTFPLNSPTARPYQ